MRYHKDHRSQSHDNSTNGYPNRNMSATTEIAHKDDSNDVAYFVRAGNEAREAGRDFKPFFQ